MTEPRGSDPVTRWGIVATAVLAGLAFGFPLVSGSGATSNAILVMSQRLDAVESILRPLVNMSQRLDTIDMTLRNFQDRLDNGPRLDQLKTIDGHLSALDGRADDLGKRMNELQTRLEHYGTKLEDIEAASKAPLRGK